MKNQSIIGFSNKASAGIAYTLFFFILAFPAASGLYLVKGVLLGTVILLIVASALVKGRFTLHPTVGLLTVCFASFGFILVLRGLLVESPGAAKMSGVFVVWPFVYLLLVGGVGNMRVLRNLEKTVVFSAVFIGSLAILFFLSQVKLIPEIPYFDSLLPDNDVAIGFYEGYIRMALPGINSLPFVVPFLMAAVVVHSLQTNKISLSIGWLWVALLLSAFVTIVSGRRAIVVVTFLAPLLILVLAFLQPPRERIFLMKSLGRFLVTLTAGTLLLVLLIRPIYSITFEGFLDRFSSGFDFSATSVDNSPDERRQQYFALERGWLEHPIFGAGLGEPAYGSVRSQEMPWAYELSYLALLFQTGLLGLFTYASGIAWIYWTSAKIMRRGGQWARVMLPLLVGMTCYLIANATNPYLTKFDGLWAIFLPIAAVNLWLVERETSSSYSSALVARPT
jgi:hypothetical protein